MALAEAGTNPFKLQQYSGILQPRDVMGAAAVDALNSLLLLSQRGASSFSSGTHVDGVWHEGRTVARRRREG